MVAFQQNNYVTKKYPKATACLAKDKAELLVFYDYPTGVKFIDEIKQTGVLKQEAA